MNDDDDANARAERARRGTPFLSTQQAAHYLGFGERHMRKLRVSGAGPRFRIHSRHIRYHIDDLEAWSLAQGRTERSHD